MQNDRLDFRQKYVESELEKLEKALEKPLRIYVAGGFVMASYGLKAGTKDIDIIVENRAQSEVLTTSLQNSGYRHLSINSVTKEYVDLSALIFENEDGFRWDIITKIVANKLTLTKSMRSRARLTHSKKKLSMFELSLEDIFLMKGVTDRERDLDDMSLIARSDVDYKIVFEECLIQSERTGKLWETGLYDKCEELKQKYGVKVPIARKLRKVAEEKMLVRQISLALKDSGKSRAELLVMLKGKLKPRDIEAGLKILSKQDLIQSSYGGKIWLRN